MADLTAQLQLEFGIKPTPPTFALEVDSRDQAFNRACVVGIHQVSRWLDEDKIDDPSEFDNIDILKPVANGYAHVRLYAPVDLPVQLLTTEPPIALELIVPKGVVNIPWGTSAAGMEWVKVGVFYGKDHYTLQWPNSRLSSMSGAVGKFKPDAEAVAVLVELAGLNETTVFETASFEYQRVVFLKYNYATAIQPISASLFKNVNGEVVEPPQFHPALGGVLLAKEDVIGSLMFKYNIQYRLFKVNYSIPSGSQFPALQRAWLSGDITRTPMLPVTVVAQADDPGRIARTDVQRDVQPRGAFLVQWGVPPKKEDKDKVVTLTEKAKVIEKVKVYNAANPGDLTDYIEVERPKEYTFNDINGQPRIFKFNFKP